MHYVEMADLDPLDDTERTIPFADVNVLMADDDEDEDDDLLGEPPGSNPDDPEDDDW